MLFRVLFCSCLCVSAATSKPSLAALCSSGAGPVEGGSGSFTVLPQYFFKLKTIVAKFKLPNLAIF
jgi:hypothetical protein